MKKALTLLNRCLPIIVFLLPSMLLGTTWYVDNSCANNGDGSTTTCAGSGGAPGPYNSMANAQSAVTGDQHGNFLLLKSGDTFREQYTIAANGTSGGQFTIGNYGAGALPIISGANVVSSWNTVVGNSSVFLTSGTSTTVPAGWTNGSNTIETIGGGGAGYDTNDATNKAPGGGGGGYSIATNVTLTPGATVAYAVGLGGTASRGSAGGNTYFCNSSTNCASIAGTAVVSGANGGVGGHASSAGGAGGSVTGAIGGTKYAGGSGGDATTQPSGSGGGGAGGPHGAGGAGGAASGAIGGGGGGGGGGAAGAATGNGGNNYLSAGGGTEPSGAGTNGGGGAGTDGSLTAGAGGGGVEWDGSHGSGGGGGGPKSSVNGGAGGLYGGAGGGGGGSLFGAGAQGIIVLTYANGALTTYWASFGTTPNEVLFDGTLLTQVATQGALATGTWWWDSSNSKIWIYDNPSGHTIEAAARTDAIVGSPSYVTFSGIHATKTNHAGFDFNIDGGPAQHIIANGVIADYNYKAGIDACTSVGHTSSAGVVENSTFAYNGQHGILLCTTDGWDIIRNSVHDNNWVVSSDDTFIGGIYGAFITNTIWEYNQSYDNGLAQPTNVTGSGLYCDTCGNGLVVRYNYSWGNKRAGIEIDAMSNAQVYGNLTTGNGHWGINAYADAQTSITGTLIYNNTVYGNHDGGIKMEGPSAGESAAGCTNNFVENNISFGTISGTNLTARLGCENPGADGSGNVYTYNDLGTQASNFLQWAESTYSTYTTWEAAAGNCGTMGCSHSTQTSPTLANAAGGQFWLTGGSPGIAAGTALGSPYNVGIYPGSSWPNSVFLVPNLNNDLGAFVYTGYVIDSVTGSGTMASGTTK